MAAVDAVCSANRAARMSALSSLGAYFRLRCDANDVTRYESTLTNALFNCIRRGKCEERCRAATALALMAWSLGEADDVFDKARRYAEKVLTTEMKKGDDYSEFVLAISIIYFVESPESYDTLALCRLLLDSAEHERSVLHRAACVSAWTFLFSTVPPTELGGSAIVEAALQTMHTYLSDEVVAVRVAAGEAVTMMFLRCNLGALSVISSHDSPITTDGSASRLDGSGSGSGLLVILARMKEIEKNLGDGENRKSKGDRSSLRKEFKEYLRIVNGEAPKPQKIALPNGQTIDVESYEDIVFLNRARAVLGDGFLRSMLSNPILHQVLDFEPVEHDVERFCHEEKRRAEKARAKDRRSKNERSAF